MKHNIVPLLEVGEHSDAIRVAELDLPGVPVEELQLDVARTERAMHWGGIKYLTLASDEGQVTTFVPGPNGNLNPDGSFSSSASKVASKVRLSDHSSERLITPLARSDYQWRNTAVYFNSGEIRQVLKDSDAASQAQSLDRSLRSALLFEIASNEVDASNAMSELAQAVVFTAILKIIPVSDEILGGSLGFVPTVLVFSLPKPWFPLSQRLYKAREQRRNDHELNPKYSTMFSFRFDRTALAARHLTRSLITLPESAQN